MMIEADRKILSSAVTGLITACIAVVGVVVSSVALRGDETAAKTTSDKPAAELPPAASTKIDFVRDVQPLLARCTNCHGFEKQESGLSLQSRKTALAGGDNGPAIVVGKSGKSRLVRLIAGLEPDLQMPPKGEGQSLNAEQIGLIRAWIDTGADWPEGANTGSASHWAYQKPVRVEPPAIKDGKLLPADWPKNAIDQFIFARLQKEGLTPSPTLDRARLLRRVSLDLIGLPPTLSELETFVQDQSADAYDRAVDRLLASPHYGERWARPWLDLARYADTHGYEKDPRRTIWPYRDWVINALNADLPFDQFTIEQLAGDLLPQPTREQRIATGFHRNTMINTEGGVDAEEYRVAAVVDRVNTTATVWLGTTLACAQCHTHKYDPFTQKEYFQLLAFFNSNADSSTGENEKLALPTPEQQAALDEIAKLEAVPTKSAELKAARDAIAEAKKKLSDQVSQTLVMRDLPKPRETHLHIRGNFLAPGDQVEPGVPAALNRLTLKDGEPANRLALARWLVDPSNPLTARVAVNRLWEQFFGNGLVLTSEDFGIRGERPSHPELLDWLATEFIAQGWSTKRMHRLIVTSATYRQSSTVDDDLLARDPYNRLLARGPRVRLEAELVRDQALAVAGLLDRKIGGPSVMPPQPEGLWNSPYSGDKWATSGGGDKYRRGLYTFWKRTSPYPSFSTFDAPSREFCVVRRPRTNTPLQALTMLNDPVYVEAAQALARRMVSEVQADKAQGDAARVTRGFRLAVSRAPQSDELKRLTSLYQRELEAFRKDLKSAEAIAGSAKSKSPQANQADQAKPEDDMAELAAWTVVANVLLNLDELVTR